MATEPRTDPSDLAVAVVEALAPLLMEAMDPPTPVVPSHLLPEELAAMPVAVMVEMDTKGTAGMARPELPLAAVVVAVPAGHRPVEQEEQGELAGW